MKMIWKRNFDKWMFILKNLHQLQDRPVKLQEKIFEKLFAEAEVAKLNSKDMKEYEQSLKAYRDNYSVLQTAKEEGEAKKQFEIAKEMKREGLSIDLISKITKLTKEQVDKL